MAYQPIQYSNGEINDINNQAYGEEERKKWRKRNERKKNEKWKRNNVMKEMKAKAASKIIINNQQRK